MFQKGDFVVHGSNGVCKIENVGTLEMNYVDRTKLYYTLQPLYQKGSRVYAPADNCKVPMRKVMSACEVYDLIEEIPKIDTLDMQDEKYLQEKYKESIKKYDCKELIRIIKTIYVRNRKRLEQGKKVAAGEEKYLTVAEDILYGELAMILNIPKDQVEKFITDKIERKHS